jgi:uncharacterized protein YkwD
VTRGFLRSSLVTCHLSLLAFSPATPNDNFDTLRQLFLERINAARSETKLSALRLSDKLSAVAQRRAQEFASGGPEPGASTAEGDGRAAVAQGYESRYLSEVLLQADGDVDMVFSQAAGAAGALAQEIQRPSLSDMGIGVAVRDEIPVYVFLFALSWEDFVAGKRAEFSNLEAVRRALLGRVNRERRAAGLPPMRGEPLLDETAQRHAADMLARSYYGHDSPEGTTVQERSQAAGYRPRSVAENIARGQYAIEEVMDGWMSSPTHREHILSPLFADIGSGLAVGKNVNGYQILWVQCFGRSKTATPWRRNRPQPPGKS